MQLKDLVSLCPLLPVVDLGLYSAMLLVEGLMRVMLNALDCKKEQTASSTASVMIQVLIVKCSQQRI
jgi:hypothetical protein